MGRTPTSTHGKHIMYAGVVVTRASSFPTISPSTTMYSCDLLFLCCNERTLRGTKKKRECFAICLAEEKVALYKVGPYDRYKWS